LFDSTPTFGTDEHLLGTSDGRREEDGESVISVHETIEDNTAGTEGHQRSVVINEDSSLAEGAEHASHDESPEGDGAKVVALQAQLDELKTKLDSLVTKTEFEQSAARTDLHFDKVEALVNEGLDHVGITNTVGFGSLRSTIELLGYQLCTVLGPAVHYHSTASADADWVDDGEDAGSDSSWLGRA
jgi:hypothetical protein